MLSPIWYGGPRSGQWLRLFSLFDAKEPVAGLGSHTTKVPEVGWTRLQGSGLRSVPVTPGAMTDGTVPLINALTGEDGFGRRKNLARRLGKRGLPGMTARQQRKRQEGGPDPVPAHPPPPLAETTKASSVLYALGHDLVAGEDSPHQPTSRFVIH